MDGSSVYHDSTSESVQEPLIDLGGQSLDYAGNTQNEAAQGNADSAVSVPCHLCDRPVRTNDPQVYREVRVWITGEKLNRSALRHYTGQYAHRDCITKVRNGLAPDEVSVFEHQEQVAGSDDTIGDDAISWDSFGSDINWRNGYLDGRAGLVPALSDGQRNANYWSGHAEGTSDRELNNEMWAGFGQPTSQKNGLGNGS